MANDGWRKAERICRATCYCEGTVDASGTDRVRQRILASLWKGFPPTDFGEPVERVSARRGPRAIALAPVQRGEGGVRGLG